LPLGKFLSSLGPQLDRVKYKETLKLVAFL